MREGLEDRDAYVYPDGKRAGRLTSDEALKEGFCPGCKVFMAGIDGEIPYLAQYEMCYDCVQETMDALGEHRYHDEAQWDYL